MAPTGGSGRVDIKMLKEEIAKLKVLNAAVEGERDFYFSKLRDIELCCEEHRPAFDNLEGTSLRTFIFTLLDVLGPQSPASNENEVGKTQATKQHHVCGDETPVADAGATVDSAYVNKVAEKNLPSPLFLFSP